LAKLQQVKHGAFWGHSVVAEAAVIHLSQKKGATLNTLNMATTLSILG